MRLANWLYNYLKWLVEIKARVKLCALAWAFKNLLSGGFGGHFFIFELWLTHMQYVYIVTQNFMTIFCPQNFPTQIFKYRFSLKWGGVIFFIPHIRIQNKILHQMICIGTGLSVIRRRKGGFFRTGLFSPTQSTWVAPRVL